MLLLCPSCAWLHAASMIIPATTGTRSLACVERRDRRVMCTTLRNSTAARTDPIHNCGSNSFCTHLSTWKPLTGFITALPPVRLLLTSANASSVGAIAGDLPFRSTDGERGKEREKESTDLPTIPRIWIVKVGPKHRENSLMPIWSVLRVAVDGSLPR